jgi:hypothetical protein
LWLEPQSLRLQSHYWTRRLQGVDSFAMIVTGRRLGLEINENTFG